MIQKFEIVRDAYLKNSKRTGLICRTSVFEQCPGVRLYREDWLLNGVTPSVGVFFSVWTNSSDTSPRLHYNIHALRMRKLPSYRITSREFAEEFRGKFQKLAKLWPNVSVKYGPLNLMEGWTELNAKSFESDVLQLMNRFSDIAPIIDTMLDRRRVSFPIRG